MDWIEAQTFLSYLKRPHGQLGLHVPRLKRILDWCANREAFGCTLRDKDPDPAAVREVQRQARG